ncbi:hypothetical protein [Herbaspirillum robiniae]|uniref:hypothetical protein n=1 Tax=Herbaspirillum robiniae TaxID=2014887 RepID=UPI003D7868DE
MLTLTEAQYQKFLARDVENFVAAVADQFIAERKEAGDVLERPVVIARMRDAYDSGRDFGITSTGHLIYMMYLSADAPGIFEDEVVQRYIRKPGATPEQRLDELMCVLKNKMRDD